MATMPLRYDLPLDQVESTCVVGSLIPLVNNSRTADIRLAANTPVSISVARLYLPAITTFAPSL